MLCQRRLGSLVDEDLGHLPGHSKEALAAKFNHRMLLLRMQYLWRTKAMIIDQKGIAGIYT